MRLTTIRPNSCLAALLLAACATGPASALAADPALLRCRAMSDAAARLACYDAHVDGVARAGSATPQSAAAPGSPATATPPAAPDPVREFGLVKPAAPAQATAKGFAARIVGTLEGWGPTTTFTLDNGQVWQVDDDSRAFYDLKNPQVRLSTGMFGTYFMDIEGARTVRVKRLR